VPADMQLLVNKLQEMKDVYEEAIRNGKYTSLIRSKGSLTYFMNT